MKTVLYYKFDLSAIKNSIYFLNNNDESFKDAYFILINDKMLFINPSQECIYLTISNKNPETHLLGNLINNTIINNKLNFSHIFAINRKELEQFLKLANKKDCFYFDIEKKGGVISGGCHILKDKFETIEEGELRFYGSIKYLTSIDGQSKDILEFVLNKKFNFENIDFSVQALNISLKYYEALRKSLGVYKKYLTDVNFSIDKTNKITFINIHVDKGIETCSMQILIAQTLYSNFTSPNIKSVLETVKEDLVKSE